MRYILLSLILLIFSGCSDKQRFQNLLNNDSIYTDAIAYTKKAVLKKESQTQVILTATYLNELYPQSFKDAEYFFIGLYAQQKKNILNDSYELTLDQTPPLSITKANKKRFQNLPLINEWTTYYLVKFPKTKELAMTLNFGNENLGFKSFQIIKNRN